MNAIFHMLMALVFANLVSQAGAQDLGTKKGKELFDINCVGCHQEGADGKPGFAPSLSNKEFLSMVSADEMARTIREGIEETNMTPKKDLGEENIRAIVSYLQSLSPLSGTRAKEVAGQPPSKGNAQSGKVMFAEICSDCHGDAGIGFDAGGSGPAIGTHGFLNLETDGYIRTTIKEGRSNTKMRGFSGSSGLANLSDSEIEDIIAYLRTVPGK
jgi:cytochrome c oxidase cbb3-type subunit 3